jgi:predicted nucleotidyltransferase
LSTLTYFDLFNYPLTQTEILLFSANFHTKKETENALCKLAEQKLVYNFDEFYTLQNDYTIVSRRRKGNLKAKSLLQTAEKVARVLSWFPFVRGVAISGSLSKNYADESSDIDLFIITQKNRLWLARSFMHILKKLSYLVNKQELFCMNYFIDEASLEIEEKNLYTATEIATLLPLRGIKAFNAFYQSNPWGRNFLPNHSMRISYVKDIEKSLLKKGLELIFNNGAGNLLDSLLMKLTSYRWKQKTINGKLNSRGIVMSMKADKHFAKPDPESFQQKFMMKYEKRVFQVLNQQVKSLRTIS